MRDQKCEDSLPSPSQGSAQVPQCDSSSSQRESRFQGSSSGAKATGCEETLAKESSRFEGQLMDANKETQKLPN
jgi:hypothetical protein